MKIFSIKEIVQATNDIFNSKNNEKKNKSIKKYIKPKTLNKNQPLKLENQVITKNKTQTDQKVSRIIIDDKVKEHIVNELYLFVKKKVKKNTLKLIFEQQIEIKNFKNDIILLKKNKNKLVETYNILEKNYEIIFKNYKHQKNINEEINSENNKLKMKNEKLKLNLIDIDKKYEGVVAENKKLSIDKSQLQSDLNLTIDEKENLANENIKLQNSLKEQDEKFEVTNQKNRSFEINNAELKNTVSRYVINLKKLQEQLDAADKSKNNELNEINQKVKFYQDENIRLSGELLLYQKKNENIKINLADIKSEKEMISNKIKELGKSIEEKANIVETKFSNENHVVQTKDLEKLKQGFLFHEKHQTTAILLSNQPQRFS